MIPESEKRLQFGRLHDYLSDHYSHTLSGEAHLLMKMLAFWEYFSRSFKTSKKVLKKLKKVKTKKVYQQLITEIIGTYPLQDTISVE